MDLKKLSFEELKSLAVKNGVKLYREEEIPVITFSDWLKKKDLTDLEISDLLNSVTQMLDGVLMDAFPRGGYHTRRTKGKSTSKMESGNANFARYKKLTEEYNRTVRTKTEKFPLKHREQDMAWLRIRLRRKQMKKPLVSSLSKIASFLFRNC